MSIKFGAHRLALAGLLFVFGATSQADESADAFIEKIKTVTYDCPNPDDFTTLNEYLLSDSLTAQQRFNLSVLKSHFLICQGQSDEAESLLFELVSQKDIDTSSYFYASAIHHIGFVYDTREQPQRCDYYTQAKNLSSPERHSDVFLSASMGLITYCQDDVDVGKRLGNMFAILERYSRLGNPGSLAHIHNAIGLVYGKLDQHVLAAEQFLKAHELGLEVYKGSNQLSILISAIISLMASGQFDIAYEKILEFEAINQNVDTPLTNFFYFHALSGYYYRTGDYAQLESVIPDLKDAIDKISNPLYQTYTEWYSAALCVENEDKACVQAYLDKLGADDAFIPKNFTFNLDYLAFFMRAQILMGNMDGVTETFDKYAASATSKRVNNQNSASILGVANLHSRIYDLESEVLSAERLRRNTLYGAAIIFITFLLVSAVVLRKRQLARLSIDPVTDMLNSETAINRISKIDAPDDGRVNAIAIFDLGNFREVNRAVGSTKGDYVLRQISHTLKKVTRGTDILGRFAPEQFILCLQNIEENGARTFFERVQNELDNTFEGENGGDKINVRSSMSIFMSTEKISNLNDVLDDMLLSIDMKSVHE